MMRITEMRAEHVSQIAELEKLCFSDPWSEGSIAYELTNPISHWVVAQDGEQVVGYIGAQIVFPEADVMNVVVHPDRRREGLGQVLLETLLTYLRSIDCTSLSLEVRVSNEIAIALYEKMGFVQVGRRPNYYRSPKEDALILQKVL